MKKILYSLFIIAFVATGCTTFDKYTSESYAAGPSITIDVTNVTDSAFTFTVTPGSGTLWYSYVVQKTDEPADLDASTLLKGKYTGVTSGVVSTAKVPTFTSNFRKSDNKPLGAPYTTYQIYAVASTDKGIVGEVVKYTVTTTDVLAPKPTTYSKGTNYATVTFAEANLKRGTGAVTATYYAEWDITNPTTVTVPEENISISGSDVTVKTPDAPAGAYVCISWAAGAFTDVFGNPCAALTSLFNTSTGKFKGVYYRIPTVGFAVLDSYFVAPSVGSSFVDWSTFSGTITFPKNVYRNETTAKSGDLVAFYSNTGKKEYYNLATTDWSVAAKSITFKLPKATSSGDKVDIQLKDSAIYDVYGNPNLAYKSEKGKWTSFEYKLSMILGKFDLTGVSTYDGKSYDWGVTTIAADPSVTNGLLFNNIAGVDGSVVHGYYDLSSGKFYMNNKEDIGTVTIDGSDYNATTYNFVSSSSKYITFSINTDGTLSSTELAFVIYDADGNGYFWDKLNPAVFTPTSSSGVRAKTRSAVSKAIIHHTPNRIKQGNIKLLKGRRF